jgi:hypothetical protein
VVCGLAEGPVAFLIKLEWRRALILAIWVGRVDVKSLQITERAFVSALMIRTTNAEAIVKIERHR